MKRRGRYKANKWYLICSNVIDWKENINEQNRGMSRAQFRSLYMRITAPKLCKVPRPRRGGRIFGYWDYGVYGETADGKVVYLYSDLPPKRYK